MGKSSFQKIKKYLLPLNILIIVVLFCAYHYVDTEIDKNKILLEGNALFTQKGLRIEADSIYYDYLEKKIIKSINAKVTST